MSGTPGGRALADPAGGVCYLKRRSLLVAMRWVEL